MKIINTIFFFIAIWWVAKWWEESRPEKKIERYEHLAKLFLDDEEKKLENVLRTEDWYTRLKEKYKHNQKKLVELAKDWKDYAYNVSQKASSMELWIENDDEKLAEDDSKEARNYFLRMEEIENRFAELPGSDYINELKISREKARQEHDKKWGKV